MKKLCLVLLGRRPWQGAPHPLHWVLPDRFLSVDLKSHSIRAENVFYLIKKLHAKEKQINFECQVIIKIFLFFLGGKVNQITQFLTFWKMMNWFLLNNLWMFLTSNTFFFFQSWFPLADSGTGVLIIYLYWGQRWWHKPWVLWFSKCNFSMVSDLNAILGTFL